MNTDFKMGDIVMLTSGGPKMTIQFLREKPEGVLACCKWFDDTKKEFREDYIYTSALSKID